MAPPRRARAAHPRARTAPAPRPAQDAVAPSPEQAAAARAEAARWAAALTRDPNAVVLDTETTSKAERGRVVEVAVLDITGRELLRTRVNPDVPIEAEAAAVHGITAAQLADAPRFSDVADALTLAVAGRRVICWNAPFDRRVLAGEYARLLGDDEAGEAWAARARWECAMRRHAAWHGTWCPDRAAWTWHKLSAVGAADHTAAGDCRAVVRVLADMARSAEQAGPGPVPHPRPHSPARSARVRLEGTRADVEAVAQALREGRAHVEHLDEPAAGRRGYLAYGRLAAHPEGTPRA
ncbi:exonuclease domain-containing protein [Nocardiopsis changdeensis]|uniref:3'-5' exonuclease n=1 Tax=Nocardiopsis changdeensis TaxID=2831969 RepID=A0A975KTV4_9ACTN|nr:MULTISPECIES: 3'-5' exonuclease [Nocardiopsis]QUX26437.1 3'-5' exonuclease [Nocardiopsis changdeensis]QYX40709.1 3'-5' exonuclease [Nocardiopsis sp. MT53]